MINISKLALNIEADSKEEKTYAKYCDELSLNPDWLKCEFYNTITNDHFIITGLIRRGQAFMLSGYRFMNNKQKLERQTLMISSFFRNYMPVKE